MKRIIALIFSIVFLPFVVENPVAVSTSARCAVLMDADSGEILYEQNADTPGLIASTTKIMTALVAIEQSPLNAMVPIRREYTLTEGSSMYLKEGEKLSLETLLCGLLLCSGNDAALAVADFCGGDVDGFVQLMNKKAWQLGMEHTAFANPSGLDAEEHYSCAKDMATLMAYAMQEPTFQRIVSTKTALTKDRSMRNHNKLLQWCEGCVGGKTGFTKAAGRTLVSCAQRDGRCLVAVTLCDGNDWKDHMALYDFGFSQPK